MLAGETLGEVALAIGPQLVEQVDHVACTDPRQRQIAELGQHVMLEPCSRRSGNVVIPVYVPTYRVSCPR